MEVEIPGLDSVGVAGEFLGGDAEAPELAIEEDVQLGSGAPITDDVEVVTAFSEEDEEHIKEKLTEAEVFVRYGLVDKAIEQLKDVLEGFRFHVESREKLIEVYKDQGMNREAAEQVVELARVFERRGENESADRLYEEARELNPALAGVPEAEAVGAEEELELTLMPEEDLDGIGLEADMVAETEAPALQESPVTELEALEPESLELEEEISAPAPEALEPETPGFEEEVVAVDAGDFELEALAVEEELPIAVQEGVSPEPGPPASAEEGIGSEEEVELTFEEPYDLSAEVELDEGTEEVSGAVGVSSDEIGAAEDISEIAVDEEIPVVEEEELAEVADLAFDNETPGILEEVPAEAGVEDGQEIDLQLPTTDFAALVSETPDPGEAPVVEMEIPESAPPTEPIPEIPVAAETPAETAGATVSMELQEVDEYIALGLYEDARDTLRELLKRSPGDSAVLGKIEELGFSRSQLQMEAAGPTPEPEVGEASIPTEPSVEIPASVAVPEELGTPLEEEPLASIEDFGEPEGVDEAAHQVSESGSEPFADFGSELSQEMFGTQSAVEGEGPVEESVGALSDPGLEEIFREFKKGVEKQLGTEDYDTRYNLGIAYKEMGLLDEAIAEFQLAAKDTARLLECCSMLGLCFLEKGMPEIAIKWFEKGLDVPGRSEEEHQGLRYDLAQAHEIAGNIERALGLYMDIYHVNARFRDVKERVRELQAAKN
jgi:tetratricopeptide (TPR) repeat protein